MKTRTTIKALPLWLLERMTLDELMDYGEARGHELWKSDTHFDKEHWLSQIHRLDNDVQINPMEKDYSQCK